MVGYAGRGELSAKRLCLQVDEGRISLDATLMSTVIWSLALFRQFESPLYDDILRGLKQWDIGQFDQESLRRLYQVHLPSCTC